MTDKIRVNIQRSNLPSEESMKSTMKKMTKEDILSVDIGDVLFWTPDFEAEDPDIESFKRSNQYSIFEEKDVVSFEFRFVKNRHGFKNIPSWELRGIKNDGTYLTDFEYLHEEYQQKDIIENDNEFYQKIKDNIWVESDEDTRFLGYLLSKGEKYFSITLDID